MTEQPPKRGRGRPPGTPNPNAGRHAMPAEERRTRHTVTLDPKLAQEVRTYANDAGLNFAEAVNRLLAMGLAQN